MISIFVYFLLDLTYNIYFLFEKQVFNGLLKVKGYTKDIRP